MCHNVTKRTPFSDMKVDNLLLEDLPTLDLLSLSEVYGVTISEIMKRRIAAKKIIYRKNYVDEYKSIEFEEGDDFMDISDVPTILKMLKCCRHLIRNFQIRNAFEIPSSYRKMPLLHEFSLNNFDKSKLYSAIGMIKNNRQIRKLTLEFATAYLLQIIANELLYLESLTLTYYQNRTYRPGIFNFHFEHLKSFKMAGATYSLPSDITFGRLERFDLNEWDGTDFREIFHVVLNNKQSLKKLRLNIGLLDSEIIELINANMSLNELSLKYREAVPIRSLTKISECTQLRKFEIHSPSMNNSARVRNQLIPEDLQSFQSHWNIIQVNDTFFRLIRIES